MMKPQLSTQKIATLIALLALLLSGASCSKMGGPKKPDNVDYYTCTMHPSVKSQDPNGKCPICSMDLVPVMKATGGESKPPASPQMQEKKDGEKEGMAGRGRQEKGEGKERERVTEEGVTVGT